MSVGEFDEFSRCSDCGYEPYACTCHGPECTWCGTRSTECEKVGSKGEYVCEGCMDDATAICVACGELDVKEDMKSRENMAGQVLHFCGFNCIQEYGRHQLVRDYQ